MDFSVGILTASDKGAAGERDDASGAAIAALMTNIGGKVEHRDVVADERGLIARRLIEWCDAGIDLIVTTGGTGFAPRDVTPEATRDVIEREAPGLAEAMRLAGLKHTPRASLSRAVCGIRGRTLIVNLPGSERAVREGLGAILQVLPHGIETVRGEGGECAR